MHARLLRCLPVLVAFALLAEPARASGLLETPLGDAATPSLAPLSSVTFSVEVDDLGARVTELRRYAVTASGADVRFYRALSPGGRVEQVTLAGVELEGQLLAPGDADAERRAVILATRNPAPLRDQGSSLFVSVPVATTAGSVEIALTTWVPLAPRGTLRGISLPLDWHEGNVGVVDVAAHVESEGTLRALFSPYHELSLTRAGPHELSGSHHGSSVCSRFDLSLLLSTGEEELHLDVLPFRYSDAEGGFFMALLTPGVAPEATTRLGRDLVLALDVSGSMAGEKLAQAKQALAGVLGGLTAEDRIGLVSFSSAVMPFREQADWATEQTRDAAAQFVGALVAGGGTNISDALARSFALLPDASGRPRYVILLTDGQPSEGITDVESIIADARSANTDDARIFAFGIGYDVNTNLLGRLADDSGGDTLYVRPGVSVSSAVEEFFQRISAPVLTQAALAAEGLELSTLYPADLPDLFAGRTLSLLGRYATPGSGKLTVQGQRGEQSLQYDFDVTLPEYAFENGFVPRIWATRRVGELLERVKLGQGDERTVDELLETARRYGVVTDFTYYAASAEGDLTLTYAGVTTDASGEAAVDAATSIGGYTQSGSAGSSVDNQVRYFQDRNFPILDGYPTDSTLGQEPAWVDLHFGSERYFELGETEAKYSANGLLAVAREVRFELLGRAFRVTDPEREDAASVPGEVGVLPPPSAKPSVGDVAVTASGTETTESPEPTPAAAPSSTRVTRGGWLGCALGRVGGEQQPSALLPLLALLALCERRRQRKVASLLF